MKVAICFVKLGLRKLVTRFKINCTCTVCIVNCAVYYCFTSALYFLHCSRRSVRVGSSWLECIKQFRILQELWHFQVMWHHTTFFCFHDFCLDFNLLPLTQSSDVFLINFSSIWWYKLAEKFNILVVNFYVMLAENALARLPFKWVFHVEIWHVFIYCGFLLFHRMAGRCAVDAAFQCWKNRGANLKRYRPSAQHVHGAQYSC